MQARELIGFVCGLILLGLTACGGGEPNVPTPIGEVTRDDLVSLIDWERSTETVVFRADVIGGTTDDFYLRSDVPPCTVYGDNRVVWTTSGAGVDDGVVWDIVSDETIRLFIEDLTLNEGVYNFSSGLDALSEGEIAPVVERLTLFVNGLLHQTDALGGWNYDYFQRIVNKCKGLSQSPIEFIPNEGWLSARVTDFMPDQPSVRWNGEMSGIRLGQIAQSGERRWVEGRYVPVFWEVLRRHGYSVQLEDSDGIFHVALEVPYFTRESPPPR